MRALVLSIAVTLFGSFASAGLLIEPYLGYTNGKLELTGSTTDEYKASGVGYGVRLGFKTMMVWGALDYARFTPTAESDLITYDFDQSQLGITAGVDIPFGLRAFAGYMFDNDLDVKSLTTTTYKGSAIKLGVGYQVPLLSLAFNLEYIMNDFKKVTSAGVEYEMDDAYTDHSYNPIFISVSAPFTLL